MSKSTKVGAAFVADGATFLIGIGWYCWIMAIVVTGTELLKLMLHGLPDYNLVKHLGSGVIYFYVGCLHFKLVDYVRKEKR